MEATELDRTGNLNAPPNRRVNSNERDFQLVEGHRGLLGGHYNIRSDALVFFAEPSQELGFPFLLPVGCVLNRCYHLLLKVRRHLALRFKRSVVDVNVYAPTGNFVSLCRNERILWEEERFSSAVGDDPTQSGLTALIVLGVRGRLETADVSLASYLDFPTSDNEQLARRIRVAFKLPFKAQNIKALEVAAITRRLGQGKPSSDVPSTGLHAIPHLRSGRLRKSSQTASETSLGRFLLAKPSCKPQSS